MKHVPSLNIIVAVTLCLFNIVFPGSGTMLSAIAYGVYSGQWAKA